MDLVTGSVRKQYDQFLTRWKKIAAVQAAVDVLSWDQQVMMPPKGATERADQMTALREYQHELITADALARTLEELDAARRDGMFAGAEAANIRLAHRAAARKRRIPADLASEIARLESIGFDSWRRAKETDDFSSFAPTLQRMIELKRQYARALTENGSDLFTPLLQDYEPDYTAADVEALFVALRRDLVPLVQKVLDIVEQPDDSLLHNGYGQERIAAFAREVIGTMGYDFNAGRVDLAPHPFCSGTRDDVRITTRYVTGEEIEMIFSTVHEAGHALYEQGLPREHAGAPAGDAVSLGVHESQSRFWEVMVGRSRRFWDHYYPKLRTAFSEFLAGVGAEEFYRALNRARAGTIRVRSDPLTYNLHIVLRFEIERALIAGDLEATDLPAAWNEKFRELFGFVPPSNAEGVLQDVHYGYGAFGYFPTYTIGNLFAAQLYEAAVRDMPGMEDGIAVGNLQPLRDWLRERVHREGSVYPARELVVRATGEPLGTEAFMRFLKARYGDVYGVAL